MLRVVSILLVVTMAACSGSSPTTPASPTPTTPTTTTAPAPSGPPTITISAAGMSPLELTVAVGQRVTFVNNDIADRKGADRRLPMRVGRADWVEADIENSRDLVGTARWGSLALGGDITGYSVPANLETSYGSPLSFHVFLRYRGRAGSAPAHVH